MISQGNNQKNEHAGGIMIPGFKVCYKSIAIKTTCYCKKTDMKYSGTE
jgi:hypothetical protein